MLEETSQSLFSTIPGFTDILSEIAINSRKNSRFCSIHYVNVTQRNLIINQNLDVYFIFVSIKKLFTVGKTILTHTHQFSSTRS